MTFLDIILVGFLIYGCIRGLWNGFFLELASLVSLVLGIFIAIKFSFIFRKYIEGQVSWSPQTVQIVAFTFTFILVVVGVSVLAKTFTTVASFASLGIFNKIAGGFFGILKAILILSVTLNVFQKVNTNYTFVEKKTLDKSLAYYPVLEIAGIVYPMVESWFMEIKEAEIKNQETKN